MVGAVKGELGNLTPPPRAAATPVPSTLLMTCDLVAGFASMAVGQAVSVRQSVGTFRACVVVGLLGLGANMVPRASW